MGLPRAERAYPSLPPIVTGSRGTAHKGCLSARRPASHTPPPGEGMTLSGSVTSYEAPLSHRALSGIPLLPARFVSDKGLRVRRAGLARRLGDDAAVTLGDRLSAKDAHHADGRVDFVGEPVRHSCTVSGLGGMT